MDQVGLLVKLTSVGVTYQYKVNQSISKVAVWRVACVLGLLLLTVGCSSPTLAVCDGEVIEIDASPNQPVDLEAACDAATEDLLEDADAVDEASFLDRNSGGLSLLGVFLALLAIGLAIYLARRTRIRIGLAETYSIVPSEVDLGVEMRIGGYEVESVYILEVSVANSGPTDLDVEGWMDPEMHPRRPRIEMPAGVTVVLNPWTPGILPGVRSVRASKRQNADGHSIVDLHVEALQSKQRATVRLVCSYDGDTDSPPWQDLRFYRGVYRGCNVTARGLLKGATKLNE